MISVPPGYTRAEVPFADISRLVDLHQPFEVEIIPNETDGTVLYFGLIDFVKHRQRAGSDTGAVPPPVKWKCIVWDLDNTLWDGVLIEDGSERIRVRQRVLDVIKQTDQRGILHSIASKNGHDEAMQVLRLAGADSYFLYPQIAWQPKSRSIAKIAELLNIGVDSMVFVDDQAFEREEVKAVLPEVRVIDAADCLTIPDRPECDVPVTVESARRRLMYREQVERQSVLESHKGDYLEFLRQCRLQLGMGPLDDTNLKRVYELAQRTNQLNFSGNRYPEATLVDMMRSAFLETSVIDCSDRFGSYGIVGFAVVDTREPRLLDLMFSCRIQGKRVEHAVLAHLLKRFVEDKGHDFHASYRRTPKNAASGRVFDEIGFECVGEAGGVLALVFKRGRDIPDDRIVKIETERDGSLVSTT